MATLTTTRAIVSTPVPTPTLSPLAAAIAAIDACGDAAAAAAATLCTLTLDVYRTHAIRLARTLPDGTAVLPSNLAGEVAARVWLDATGLDKSPEVAIRTSGQTSLGQYVSMFAKVAKDLGYGVAALQGTPAEIRTAYNLIRSGNTAAKQSSDYRAFVVWLSGQHAETRAAFVEVSKTLATDGGKDHLSAFIAMIKA